ncbi:MAG: isoaspartyl peptidase/L-asparaginase [Planctomycetes bacterium]|nr:isoaspartyl peptidase/L-asparaginase [Planctomycetota bacterium]
MRDENVLTSSTLDRRTLLGAALGAGAALSCSTASARQGDAARPAQDPRAKTPRKDHPVLIGSANGLAGMKLHYAKLLDGADPLDVVIEVVKVQEADPLDDSVGLGGLPNAEGVVQLDAACMYGPRHKSGAVACIENILHPCEVARLVLERTDHCLLVGKDAYRFAREHGHPHTELLTEASRKRWLEWRENLSREDDWLPPPPKLPFTGALPSAEERRVAAARRWNEHRVTGTIHCSGLAKSGAVACTTTTSGLAWKIPGRVGDSPIVGAGLYCDQDVGSAGGTGRGESAILANASFAVIELLRQGATPLDAGLEVLRRVTRQTQRQSRYQPELVDEKGIPSFGLHLYVLALDGTFAGVTLKGEGQFAVADPEKGPRLERLVALHAG